jgi:hypothetical protein
VKHVKIYFLTFVFLSFSCKKPNTEKLANFEKQNKNLPTSDSVKVEKAKEPDMNIRSRAAIEVKTFHTDQGWGYDISLDGKPYIHQPYIPAIEGNSGFKSEAAARKTAELTVTMIRNNILPPSINSVELDSLGVLN